MDELFNGPWYKMGLTANKRVRALRAQKEELYAGGEGLNYRGESPQTPSDDGKDLDLAKPQTATRTA
jgi:hypothetical protein